MQLAIVSTYPPESCGIGTYTSYLARELVRSGCDTTILTEWAGPAHAHQGLEVRPCFERDADYVGPILAAVAELDPDVVHIQHEYGIFGFDHRFLSLLAELRRRGYPAVVTLHTVHTALSMDLGCSRGTRRPPADFDVESYQASICALASLVIVHQDRTIRQVLIRQGAAPDRTVAVPHGTLVPRASPRADVRRVLRMGVDDPLIVSLGYFEPSKNGLLLLEALAVLHRQYPRMKAIVSGHIRHPVPETLDYWAACRNFVERHRMEDYVTVLKDELSEQAMTDLFAAADAACFVYREDTRSSSGALHRAIGCGVPIVASRIAKFDEVAEVADELLVSPDRSGELMRVLGRLLGDAPFRNRMAGQLAELAERSAWPLVARRHLALYGAIPRHASRRRPRHHLAGNAGCPLPA